MTVPYMQYLAQPKQVGALHVGGTQHRWMGKQRVAGGQVDTELVYAYAKTGDMGALEEFMAGAHQANLQSVGDRVFEEGMFEAARAIFAHIPNWGRLASTLVRLHQFQAAVDAARKANSPRTWKEVRAP